MAQLELVKHLAELSKLRLSEDALERKAEEMEDIIRLMDSIKEFSMEDDKTGVNDAVCYNNLREDKALDSFPRREITKNAKAESGGYFTVPKVVE